MKIFHVTFAAMMAYSAAFAQSPAKEPSFDVASIRVTQGATGENMRITPGVLAIEGYTLGQCLQWAWSVQRFQIQGPDSLKDLRFTINAKASASTTEDDLRLMLRKLLIERFAISMRHDVRELATYNLVLVKGGPKFHDVGGKDSSKFMVSTSAGTSSFTKDKAGLIAERATIGEVGEKLSEPLQRPVIDKTGLKDRYDIRIDTTSYMNPSSDGEQQQTDRLSLIFNALQGQLGIKVEAAKDKVDFLIIDAASPKPTEN